MITLNNHLAAARVAGDLNSHYARLSASMKRLSTGLRINSAADDAAGIAIRELMRADVAALNQGVRNANDAISMLQVADGALGVIDEKLIRMKELAEQSATGTYDSVQRLMIHSEFQAMGEEIDRIARATDFNGIKLLDGSLDGVHDGSGLASKGRMKIHFGSANDSAEDYYYVEIGNCTLGALGLRETIVTRAGGVPPASLLELEGATLDGYAATAVPSGIVPMAYIPKGSQNVVITVDGLLGAEDDIQIFTRDGCHLAGTKINPDAADNDNTWASNGVSGTGDASKFMTEANGFNPGASYRLPAAGSDVAGNFNDGGLSSKDKDSWGLNSLHDEIINISGAGSMRISYSGDYDRLDAAPNDGNIIIDSEHTKEKLVIDEVVVDLLIVVSGKGIFNIDTDWDYMPPGTLPDHPSDSVTATYGDIISIRSQSKAQEALTRIDDAIVAKDKVRAHLGALQNRLENTVTSLVIQGENLQVAESGISDTDIAQEMTHFVREHVLSQSATAMLGQANSCAQMLSGLLNG